MTNSFTGRAALAAAVMAACIGGPALAESPIPGEFSANVSLGTDYVFRGISQTDEDPTIQGGLDWSHDSGVYLGIWASNVDFNDGDEAHIEADIYGGWKPTFGGFTFDIGGIYYAYPGADNDLNYDYVEAKLGASYDFEVAEAGVTMFYSPNFFGGGDDAFYLSGDVAVPLPYSFSLGGHLGHQWISDNTGFGTPDYLDWALSVTYALEGVADFKLAYTDTDLKSSECNDICDARAVFSVSRSF